MDMCTEGEVKVAGRLCIYAVSEGTEHRSHSYVLELQDCSGERYQQAMKQALHVPRSQGDAKCMTPCIYTTFSIHNLSPYELSASPEAEQDDIYSSFWDQSYSKVKRADKI